MLCNGKASHNTIAYYKSEDGQRTSLACISRLGFLNRSATDILDQVIVSCGKLSCEL